MKGIHVRWCMNEECKLFGIDSDELKICKICDSKLSQLVWTLIICEPRGIYMGLIEWPKEMPKEIMGFSVRACVYYVGTGSNGLATVGPKQGSRITGAVDQILIQSPKTFATVSMEALKAWEDEPWS